jgi:hypothetical protein
MGGPSVGIVPCADPIGINLRNAEFKKRGRNGKEMH